MNLVQNSDLYISADSLSPPSIKIEDLSLNASSVRSDSIKTITWNNLPTFSPQVITTTKTLRRFFGFILALIGFTFYFLRMIVLIFWICFNIKRKILAVSGLEGLACGLGIGLFHRIMKYPYLTLESNNFKNVWWFLLIPSASFLKVFISTAHPSLFLPTLEVIFYSVYLYGISLNGRSSSMWAGFKPYRFEVIPLILQLHPASRTFPQYTIPPSK